jgi:hypothetical protein
MSRFIEEMPTRRPASSYRRHVDGDVDQSPVLATPHDVGVHGLARADAGVALLECLACILRREHIDGLADGLARGIAEQPLGRGIPGADGAVGGEADDGARR